MMQAEMSTKAYDWREAASAVRALLRKPDDVAQVFRIVNALPGHAIQRATKKLRKQASGARLLRDQPAIVRTLCDRARLEAMPEGSLGRCYLAFMDAENISAEGLLAAEDAAGAGRTRRGDEEFVWAYLRDTHDLWHVVTGYRGDLLGEPALQAFNFAQTWNPGIGFLAMGVFLKGGKLTGVRRLMIDGFFRGLRAAWMVGEDWEHLLPLPLDEVRRRLRVPPLRPYAPIRLSDFPDGKFPG
jgi:ubiquinone biosynthesis protein COQ4